MFLYRHPQGMRTIGALPMALWIALLVDVGYAFGAKIETAVETGWGAAGVVLLALMLIGTVYSCRRTDELNAAP